MGNLAETPAKLPNYQITHLPDLRKESQIFRQRTRVRYFKQRPWAVGIDGQGSVARQENGDLGLRSDRDYKGHDERRLGRITHKVGEERVGILLKSGWIRILVEWV